MPEFVSFTIYTNIAQMHAMYALEKYINICPGNAFIYMILQFKCVKHTATACLHRPTHQKLALQLQQQKIENILMKLYGFSTKDKNNSIACQIN